MTGYGEPPGVGRSATGEEQVAQRERLARIETKLDNHLSTQARLELAQNALSLRTESVNAELRNRIEGVEHTLGSRINAIESRLAWAVGVGIALYSGFLFFAPTIRHALFGIG